MAKSTTPRFGDEGFPLWKHKATGLRRQDVRGCKESMIDKTAQAVTERLAKEYS